LGASSDSGTPRCATCCAVARWPLVMGYFCACAWGACKAAVRAMPVAAASTAALPQSAHCIRIDTIIMEFLFELQITRDSLCKP
jgi:hypothetical protein